MRAAVSLMGMMDFAFTLPQAFMLALSALMLWVVISDATHYIISNRLNALVLGLYVVAMFMLPMPALLPAVGAAALIFVLGLGLFALGLMGGGDVKLLVGLSLWTGGGMPALQFMFMTAIAGGVLVILVLTLRVVLSPLWLKLQPTRALPRILTRKQPVPYGIAIAAAFGWMLWNGQVAGLVW